MLDYLCLPTRMCAEWDLCGSHGADALQKKPQQSRIKCIQGHFDQRKIHIWEADLNLCFWTFLHMYAFFLYIESAYHLLSECIYYKIRSCNHIYEYVCARVCACVCWSLYTKQNYHVVCCPFFSSWLCFGFLLPIL